MPVFLASYIQLGPIAVPVEGDADLGAGIYFFECVEIDLSGDGIGEEPKRNFVLGIRFRKKVVEDTPVLKSDTVDVSSIGNFEQEAVCFALDLVL